MSARSQLEEMLSGKKNGVPLIDIGTTSLTGIRVGAVPRLQKNNALAHPIFKTIPLEPTDCIHLGSDFIRTGLLYDPQVLEDERYIDAFGVEWLRDEGDLAPFSHPLETAGLRDIAHHPKPQWLQPVQQVEPELARNSLVIADAPCPGLLDMCFMLRSTWKLMEDISENPLVVSALLEWSLETITSAYEHLLASLDKQPDVIIYNDDLGFQNGMFLSPLNFRNYVRPYLRTLLTHLRTLTPAAICFHSCGAISPIVPDIADLNIEIVNLDTYAKGMDVMRLRQELPSSVVLHGSNDLCALGVAVAKQDKARIAFLITELAHSAPVIAGPMDNMSSADEVLAAVRGATFIRNFSDDDFEKLRRLGPVRSIIEGALEKTLSMELLAI
ncbi:hypothetical protein JCM15765_35870 [Paradesulfitobacterium aromaticivorans]